MVADLDRRDPSDRRGFGAHYAGGRVCNLGLDANS